MGTDWYVHMVDTVVVFPEQTAHMYLSIVYAGEYVHVCMICIRATVTVDCQTKSVKDFSWRHKWELKIPKWELKIPKWELKIRSIELPAWDPMTYHCPSIFSSKNLSTTVSERQEYIRTNDSYRKLCFHDTILLNKGIGYSWNCWRGIRSPVQSSGVGMQVSWGFLIYIYIHCTGRLPILSRTPHKSQWDIQPWFLSSKHQANSCCSCRPSWFPVPADPVLKPILERSFWIDLDSFKNIILHL